MTALVSRTGAHMSSELRTGLRMLRAAVLGGGWFALVPLAGAVVVPGNLVVQSNVKTIQHPTGGVVAEIRVAQRHAGRVPAICWCGSMRLRRRPASRW